MDFKKIAHKLYCEMEEEEPKDINPDYYKLL